MLHIYALRFKYACYFCATFSLHCRSLMYIGPYRGGICRVFRVTSEVVYSMQSSFRLTDYNAHNIHHAHLSFCLCSSPNSKPGLRVSSHAPMHLHPLKQGTFLMVLQLVLRPKRDGDSHGYNHFGHQLICNTPYYIHGAIIGR